MHLHGSVGPGSADLCLKAVGDSWLQYMLNMDTRETQRVGKEREGER